MRRFFSLFISIIIAISFTSCIDLIEEISINKDLSGHYELRLEAGGLGGMMSMAGGQMEIPAIKELDEKVDLLKHQAGISHVQKKIHLKSMQFYISFDFEDEKSLNEAMYQLATVESNVFIKKFLKIRKHKVIRPNLTPYLKLLIEDQNLMDQIPSEDMLSYVNYKFILNTPTEIKQVKGKRAIIQSNKKTVISSFSFKDLLVNKENVYLKIKM